jgi:hypothetical protein
VKNAKGNLLLACILLSGCATPSEVAGIEWDSRTTSLPEQTTETAMNAAMLLSWDSTNASSVRLTAKLWTSTNRFQDIPVDLRIRVENTSGTPTRITIPIGATPFEKTAQLSLVVRDAPAAGAPLLGASVSNVTKIRLEAVLGGLPQRVGPTEWWPRIQLSAAGEADTFQARPTS